MSRSAHTLRRKLFVQSLEDRRVPAGYSVTLTGDTGAGGGSFGDIRFCVNQANASPGNDTITFVVTGTIVLTSQLSLTGPTVIDGPGAHLLTINANQKSRIFDINTASPVTINDLLLINGAVFDNGGLVRLNAANGNLSIFGCVLANSTSSIGSGGGAISVAGGGLLSVDTCVISGNSGLRGAGIYFGYGGSLNLSNSTLSGNMQSGSTGGGGAVYFYGDAGTFSIQNCTISGNTASGRGGGVSINSGNDTFTINNSTITGNTSFEVGGGGIGTYNNQPILQLESTIVAQNVHPYSPDMFSPGVVNAKNCLFGVSDGIATFNATECYYGNSIVPLDPRLGPLDDNNGPTPTHLPLPSSPLRNNGSNPGALMFDQRGEARTVESLTDIGAVESASGRPNAVVIPMPVVVTPGGGPNTVQVKYTDGFGVLATTFDVDDIQIFDPVGKAVPVTGFSVNQPGSGTPRIVTYTFSLPGGSWDAADSGAYRVDMAANQVLNTTGLQPVLPGTIGSFVVSMSHTYVVNSVNDELLDTDALVSLREAIARSNAPGSPDTITFDSSLFSVNHVISLALGQLPLYDAVSITGPTVGVTIDAKAKSRHFAINANGTGSKFALSNLTLINGKMSGVFPADRGGSIRIADESVTLTNCILANNTAEASGGAIYTDSFNTVLKIQDCAIRNNASTGDPTLNVGSGGAIGFGQPGALTIDRTTLSGNSANGAGGGLYFYYGGQATISNSTISGNIASGKDVGGGGIYFFGEVTGTGFKITNTTISGNTAINGAGGGLSTFLNGGVIEFANSTVAFNVSKAGGGLTRVGGFAPAGTFSLNSTIVARNTLNDTGSTQFDISLPSAGNITGNNNLVGVANIANFTLTGSGNKTGTTSAPLNPLLGTLDDNGGPTQSHVLQDGSPALDSGNNSLGLTFDQRGMPFIRASGVSADIGAFERQGNLAKVTQVVVNDGAAQRSRVLSVTVNFDRVVAFVGDPADAFLLVRQSPPGSVGLTATVDDSGSSTSVRLTFSGALVENLSLLDGRYTLRVFASQIAGSGLDSNGNGVADGSPMDDFVAVGAPGSPERLYRIFGDGDGDGDVDGADFNLIRYAFMGPNVAFDLNNNDSVDGFDFKRFRQNFNGSI